jgi:hypothetical protein
MPYRTQRLSESDPAATAADASIEDSNPVDDVCKLIIQLYIAGDMKFEFTMAGRDGHAGSSCL